MAIRSIGPAGWAGGNTVGVAVAAVSVDTDSGAMGGSVGLGPAGVGVALKDPPTNPQAMETIDSIRLARNNQRKRVFIALLIITPLAANEFPANKRSTAACLTIDQRSDDSNDYTPIPIDRLGATLRFACCAARLYNEGAQ